MPRANYNNRNSRRSDNGQNQYDSGGQRKKHSGAKESLIKTGLSKGLLAVTGWNYSEGKGMIVLSAFEHSGSTHSESDKGNKFVSLVAEVFYKNTGQTLVEPCIYNLTTGKMAVGKLSMVISTKAPNGGYFGQIKK